jgi:proline dehydrogenase
VAGNGTAGAVRTAPERVARSLLLALSQQRALGRLATATPVTRPLVHRFVAGESLPEALPRLQRLKRSGFHSTVDMLGEAVTSAEEAVVAAQRYVETLDALVAAGLDRNVSLKLTQLGLAIDRDLAKTNLERVAEHAAKHDGFVRIDMEDSSTTNATLAVHRRAWATHGNIGVVIQSCLRRSPDDIDALNADGVRIRLCKGAYRERRDIAYTTRAEIDDAFDFLAERLLRKGTYPAFATHDERLVRRVIALAKALRVNADRFEFQMLYGIRRDLQDGLLDAGYTVRVYVPFGQEWYPYFMRRLAERPANLMFLVPGIPGRGRRR